MIILGINAYHGDAAAAIVRDGELIAAVEEERFNRIKHCAGFPTQSIQYCLRAAGIGIEEVDHVGISRDPSAHLHKKVLMAVRRLSVEGRRQLAEGSRQEAVGRRQSAVGSQDRLRDSPGQLALHVATEDAGGAPAVPVREVVDIRSNGNGHGFARQLANRLRNAAKVRDLKADLAKALGVSTSRLRARFHNIEHHRAHLASSFFVSPFERAALLSLDGFGDFISTMWGEGVGNSIEVLGQVEYPHSLGIVYTATTQFLGFPHYGDEGKVMGLAPYGEPRFVDQFREIVRTERDGRFGLNLDYFRHASEGVDMTWDGGSPKIGRLFSDEYADTFGPPRLPDAPLTRRDRDVAASLQLRLEEVAFHVLNHLHEQTGLTELGLAGGVAYNSVMNGKILTNTPFRRVFIQPAAGDSGTAIGVCYQIWSEVAQAGSLRSQISNLRHSPYTGPEFSQDEIATDLRASSLDFETLKDRELVVRAARDIADGLVVGWFQGRMEFGPRALGNRSILADPRRIEMKDIVNTKIKFREPYRPFAPSVLASESERFFDLPQSERHDPARFM